MSNLHEYEVEIGGVKHTLQLDDHDAAARGLSRPSEKSDSGKSNKSRKPANKSAS